MRTDSRMSADAVDAIRALVGQRFGPQYACKADFWQNKRRLKMPTKLSARL